MARNYDFPVLVNNNELKQKMTDQILLATKFLKFTFQNVF